MARDEDDESHSSRLSRKHQEAPMMLIGLAGLVIVCGIGVHKFNKRGTMPVSQFLMQLRVAAQGTVVAALTMGAVYSMLMRSTTGGAVAKDSSQSNKSTKPKNT